MNTPTTTQKTPVIKVSSVIGESWQLVRGLKAPIFLLGLLATFFSFMFSSVVTMVFISQVLSRNFFSFAFLVTLACVLLVALWFTIATMTLLGVRQAIHLPAKISIALSQCISVASNFLYLAFIWIGICALFYLPTHYLLPKNGFGLILYFITYLVILYLTLPLLIFAAPLIVTKHCHWQYALKSSFNKMNQYWVPVMTCYIIMILISIISAIPLGIGLIWTIPMHYAMAGVLFRDVYGLRKVG